MGRRPEERGALIYRTSHLLGERGRFATLHPQWVGAASPYWRQVRGKALSRMAFLDFRLLPILFVIPKATPVVFEEGSLCI